MRRTARTSRSSRAPLGYAGAMDAKQARSERWRRRALLTAALLGALAVLSGAFGAHALSSRLPARLLEVWSTAVRYHMWHALALLALSLSDGLWHGRLALAGGACWVAGILLFSGSLYLMALTGVGALGAITPLGGVALLLGWLLVAAAALRSAAR
jgi:uncharacterized membrane protein YgdD (TMEM256/DUF423 family)